MQDQAGRIPKFMLEHVLDISFARRPHQFFAPAKLALEMVFLRSATRAVLSIDTLITNG